MIDRYSSDPVPGCDAPDIPPAAPVETSNGKKRFPWHTLVLLLVIMGMSVGNMFIDEARRTYKKGFEEMRGELTDLTKICNDQTRLINEQSDTIEGYAKDSQKKAEDVKMDGAMVAITSYNLGYAHYPPDQFLGLLTNQLGITNAVVGYFTNEVFDGEMTNESIRMNRREL